MNIYQARLILKERIEDYLLSFRNSGDFCNIVSGLANDYLSLEHIQNSILIESSNECFFVGDSSAQSACGFGIEYNNDSIYIGEWKNGKYDGHGYLLNKHVCYYGCFANGAYKDSKSIIANDEHYIISFYDKNIIKIN